jgi:hypothetical protein
LLPKPPLPAQGHTVVLKIGHTLSSAVSGWFSLASFISREKLHRTIDLHYVKGPWRERIPGIEPDDALLWQKTFHFISIEGAKTEKGARLASP